MKSEKERNIPIWAKGVRPKDSTDSSLSEEGGCAVAVLVQVSLAFWVLGAIGMLGAFQPEGSFLTPAVWIGVGFLSFVCVLLLKIIKKMDAVHRGEKE